MSRPAPQPDGFGKSPKGRKNAKPDDILTATQLVRHLIAQGWSKIDAWDRARELLKPLELHNGIVAMPKDRYNNDHKGKAMSATKTKTLPQNAEMRRCPEPEGDECHHDFARGVIRWATSKGMSIPDFCQKFDLTQTSIYQVVRANSPQTTGKYIPIISKAIGVHYRELLDLGRNP